MDVQSEIIKTCDVEIQTAQNLLRENRTANSAVKPFVDA